MAIQLEKKNAKKGILFVFTTALAKMFIAALALMPNCWQSESNCHEGSDPS